jgi:SAM-dependent methyltransferase
MPIPWLDAQRPHDEDVSAAQVAALLELLGPPPRRVLDLGCGAGRSLVPLAQAGHDVCGIDRDEGALAQCAANLNLALGGPRTARSGARAARAAPGARARLRCGDFHAAWPAEWRGLDAIVCLGNTLMTICEVDSAVALLGRGAAALRPDGAFIVDDCPGLYWPEVSEGRWCAGTSPDGDAQLVWAGDDAVFTVRTGSGVDPACWELRPGDLRLRLWTRGAIDLAARAAGLSASRRVEGGALLIMRAGAGAGGRA